MNFKTFAIALSLTLGSAFAQVTTLPFPGGEPSYDSVRQFLTLSEAQANKLVEVQKSRQAAEQAIYEQMQQRHTQLNQLLQAGSNDAATVGRLMIEINNLQRQLPNSGTPFRASALAVLNDAQKAKLPQLVQALELQGTAGEAAALNLIDYPRVQSPRLLPGAVEPASVTVVSER